jgi:hypothetical protein
MQLLGEGGTSLLTSYPVNPLFRVPDPITLDQPALSRPSPSMTSNRARPVGAVYRKVMDGTV